MIAARTVVLCVMLSTASVQAADYYVSPSGSDANPCTLAQPCATVPRAQTLLRSAIVGGMHADVHVYLRSGAHRITSGLTFGAADSGRNGHTVVVTSYNGEAAVIDGGVQITGWSLYSGSIYRAAVAPGTRFRQLYVGRDHGQRARGPLNPAGWTRTAGGYTAPDSAIASWGNIAEIEAVSLGTWSIDFVKFATAVGTAVTMTTPAWTNQTAIYSGYVVRATPSYLENARELLDTAGEWYLDSAGGYLYLWPPGETMIGVTVTAPLVQTLLSINGASNITFTDLSFSHSNWTGPDLGGLGYVGLQSGDSFRATAGSFDPANIIAQPGAIDIANSTGIIFSHNTVLHTGARSLVLHAASSSVEVANVLFDDNASGQIQIGDALEGTTQRVSGANVHGNYVTGDNQWMYTDASAIYASLTQSSSVTNNTIVGARWAAISASFVADDSTAYAADLQISRNAILNGCSEFWDCSPIYVRDRTSITGSLADGLRVTANDILGRGGQSSVYVDIATSWATVSGNVVRGAPRWMWAPNPATNNTLGPEYSDTTGNSTAGCTSCTVTGPVAIATAPLPAGSAARGVACAAGALTPPGATAGQRRKYGRVLTYEGKIIPWRPCADSY